MLRNWLQAQSHLRIALALFVIAFAVRIAVTTMYPESVWNDAAQYDTLARNLIAGNGYSMAESPPYEPTMFREPLFPVFLALAYAVPGDDVGVAHLLQILLGALSCSLLYQLAVTIGATRGVALLAGILSCFHPGLALYSGRTLSETLSSFLVTLSLLLFARAWSSARTVPFLWAGVAAGAASLTKSSLLLLPLALAATHAGVRIYRSTRRDGTTDYGLRQRTRELRHGGLVPTIGYLCAVALTIAPWSVRNAMVLGNPAISVRGGEVLWARAFSMDRSEQEVSREMYRRWDALRDQGLSETETDTRMREEAMTLLRESPLRYLAGNPRQARNLWICSSQSTLAGDPEQVCTDLKSCLIRYVRPLVPALFFGMFLVMVLGGVLLLRGPAMGSVPVVAVGYLTLIHSFFALNSCRYAIPVVPAAMLLVAVGLFAVWDARRNLLRRSAREPADAS